MIPARILSSRKIPNRDASRASSATSKSVFRPSARFQSWPRNGEGLGVPVPDSAITIWDFTGRKDSSGNQRESATLFPQGLSLYSRRACPFIPAGLSFYSRRAVLLFPQGCPFIPAGLPQPQPRAAFSSCPACADGDGRDPCRQACGPATIVRLLRSAVARRPRRRAS